MKIETKCLHEGLAGKTAVRVMPIVQSTTLPL